MEAALARTGTRRFRYLVGPPGYDFPLGTATLTFTASSFKTADTTSESGETVPGTPNERTDVTFAIDGATAVLREPGTDITTLNQRGWFEVEFRASRGATLTASTILDGSDEFELRGAAAAGVTLLSVEQASPACSGTTSTAPSPPAS